MAAISWSQIDTNGNGYVDGTEAVTAKAKGVKNVWNTMTEVEYLANRTLENKLSSIHQYVKQATESYQKTYYQYCDAGISNNEYKSKKEKLEKQILSKSFDLSKIDDKISQLNQELEAASNKKDDFVFAFYNYKWNWFDSPEIKGPFNEGPETVSLNEYKQKQKEYFETKLGKARSERMHEKELIESELKELHSDRHRLFCELEELLSDLTQCNNMLQK